MDFWELSANLANHLPIKNFYIITSHIRQVFCYLLCCLMRRLLRVKTEDCGRELSLAALVAAREGYAEILRWSLHTFHCQFTYWHIYTVVRKDTKGIKPFFNSNPCKSSVPLVAKTTATWGHFTATKFFYHCHIHSHISGFISCHFYSFSTQILLLLAFLL